MNRRLPSSRASPAPLAEPVDVSDEGLRPEAAALLVPADALAQLASRPGGLAASEAVARLQLYGRNELSSPPDRRMVREFLQQFVHLMALLLWVGAGIALMIGLPELAGAIVAVIVINGAFSFWQEYQAERATHELSRLLPANATVYRDGAPQQVAAADLVPGDVISLLEGDSIPADARLLEAHLFATSDAALTGESASVSRLADPLPAAPAQATEATNCVFAGSTVASGRALAVVLTTGDRTAFGAIARLTRRVRERPSPLSRELDRAVSAISRVAVGVGLSFGLLALPLVHLSPATALTFALGLIVAFVPEGLLPTLTLSLAMSVRRMARRRALVRHLPAVEALGAATAIASDKTGVLTENRMRVVYLFASGEEFAVTGEGYAPIGEIRRAGDDAATRSSAELAPLLQVAALCNYSRLRAPATPDLPWDVVGDPTEGALQVLAVKGGVRVEDLVGPEAPLAAEWPFDARRQLMSVAYREGDRLLLLTKGSPRPVLERCRSVRHQGDEHELTEGERGDLEATVARFATQGLRVLALARRALATAELNSPAEQVEHDLVFLGLVAMQDPPRPDVAEVVRRCRRAGIRVAVVSGDQGTTVAAIARQVGILSTPDAVVVEGDALSRQSDEELRSLLASRQEVVFARTPPEGKLRVVQALQALGHVVAVTGDGVNDAPALRQADIGVAMGLSGTDVARAAADIVLADDHFGTIVAAIEEGRAVFDNIRKFTTYCFTSNAAEAVPFILFLLSGGRIPLALPIMLVLAVDLGTDMLPALALGAETAEADVMERPPRQRSDHLISADLLVRSLLWLGLLEGAAGMAAFFLAGGLAPAGDALARARGAALAGVVAAQVANLFVCRSERGAAFARPWNPLLVPGLVAELMLLGAVLFVPVLQRVFGTAPLHPRDWLAPLLTIPIFFLLEEARKAVGRRRIPARH